MRAACAVAVLLAHAEARLAGHVQVVDGIGADIDDVFQHAFQLAVGGQFGALRADRQGHRAAARGRRGQPLAVRQAHAVGVGLALEEVGFADEVGDRPVQRRLVDVAGCADLQHLALAHHRDAVGHGQRFLLVVGDEDEGDPGLVLQALQLDLHFLAQLQVQRRQRLVEQQHLGPAGQRAGQGDALLLATGQLVGAALADLRQLHQVEHAAHRGVDLAARAALHLQAEADVLGDAHVREQRITLEHRVDRAAERRQAFHAFAIEADAAGAGLFETGDEAEEGGLAAAGRAEEGEEFVGVDIQGHIVKGLQALAGGTEFHADPLDGYRAGHAEFHAVKQLLLLRFCGFWGPLHLLRFDNDRGAAGAER